MSEVPKNVYTKDPEQCERFGGAHWCTNPCCYFWNMAIQAADESPNGEVRVIKQDEGEEEDDSGEVGVKQEEAEGGEEALDCEEDDDIVDRVKKRRNDDDAKLEATFDKIKKRRTDEDASLGAYFDEVKKERNEMRKIDDALKRVTVMIKLEARMLDTPARVFFEKLNRAEF